MIRIADKVLLVLREKTTYEFKQNIKIMNRITYLDFFRLSEVIGKDVKLEMSYTTIQKIYSVNGGMDSAEHKISESLNGLNYDVVDMIDDKVLLKSNSTLTSWNTMEFELYL